LLPAIKLLLDKATATARSALGRVLSLQAVQSLRGVAGGVGARLAGFFDRDRPEIRSFQKRLIRSRIMLRRSLRKAGAAALAPDESENDDQLPKRKKGRWMFQTGLAIVILSLLSGLMTYFVLTGLTPIEPTHKVVITVWLINGVLIMAMIAIIALQLYGLWHARRREAAGARLHVRIVSLFSLVALFPAVLLAVFASISLDRGLDHLFSENVKTIIRDSVDVANAYLVEHGKTVRADALGMARELENAAQLRSDNPEAFQRYAAALAIERRLPYAYLINGKGKPVLEVIKREGTAFEPPPAEALRNAADGRISDAGLTLSGGVGAIKRLANYNDLYLYVRRPVDQTVIGHLRRTNANVRKYGELHDRRTGLQIAFAMMYVVIALTLLLASIWMGLWFANRLVAPIRRLIGAAQEVSKGNLDVTVRTDGARSDTGQLGITFNRMTADLRSQRDALVGANTALDERRRFTEAVLSGVTAGVIGVDSRGVITLVNSSATRLLSRKESQLIGKPIAEAVPEFAAIVTKASGHARRAAQSQISYRRDGSDLTLSVRVTQEAGGKQDYGFVVTFDDITELVVAQRTSAWADVARRIAHEIKNPLTPIQLSAERIRRKYGDAIRTDREVFDRCTDTIIRHVGDIGRMVDEFSAFARMPKPVFETHDVAAIVKEAVILFQMSNADVEYDLDLPEKPLMVECDRGLLTQATTNLVKNAGEAIATARQSGEKGDDYKGRIIARVSEQATRCLIEVIDNGCGLPAENRNRLTEPYVTTRQKGTGLGLAIVHRIAEQHDAVLELGDAVDGEGRVTGAIVRMVIPMRRAVEIAETTEASDRRGDGLDGEQSNYRYDGGKQGVSYGV
jgi:two-component system nitrogen regulation sensor histidine kinase NtrY